MWRSVKNENVENENAEDENVEDVKKENESKLTCPALKNSLFLPNWYLSGS